MAVYQDNGRGAVPGSQTSTTSLSGLAYGAGALLSVALTVSVGVWGYNLVMRDVTGVPVVRATKDPMRVMPEDPGGAPAEHQGLAVNKVAGQGVAEKPADRLILAPRPVQLAAEDSPSAQLDLIRLTQDIEPKANDPLAADAPVPLAITAPDPVNTDTSDAETDEAEVASLLDDLKPEVVEPPKEEPVKIAGLQRVLRPKTRPANARPAAITSPSADLDEDDDHDDDDDDHAVKDIDPKTLAAGTRLAQLGAYESVAVAQTEWLRLSGRFEEFFEYKQRVIQRAESGGRTFYRLRVHGFDDISDARRFCSALLAERTECIPVTTK